MQAHTPLKRAFIAAAALASILLMFSSRPAYADVPSASESPVTPVTPSSVPEAQSLQLTLMGSELELFAGQAKKQRTAVQITTVVSALALGPAGYVLARRSDPLSQSVGIGMVIGGAVPLLTLPFVLRASGMERVRDAFEKRRASGMAGAELLRFTESDWERTANAAHTRRIVVGITDLVLGTASTAAGLFFLLSDPVAKMDRDDQNILGSSLIGPGIPLAFFGIHSLLHESVEETSWEAYRAAKVITDPQPARLRMPEVSVAPLRGGAAAAATFTF